MGEFVSSIQRKVGWFLILGMGAIVLIILSITLRSDIFSNKFLLYFSPPSAASFYEGQPVQFQGFKIGRIKKMELQHDGTVRISVNVLERYRPMMHQGSIIHLIRDGLIGEQTIEITAGNTNQPIIKQGQQIPYETAASIEQLLQDIKPAVENANALLHELAMLATWLNDPESDLRQMVARMNALSQGLTAENIGQMANHFTETLENLQVLTKDLKDNRIGEQLATSLKATSEILADLRPLSQQIAEQGPDSLQHINSLIKNVDQLSRSLDTVASDLGELTPELPGLARESRASIKQMQSVLKKLEQSWLIGNQPTPAEADEDALAPPVLEMQP